MLKKASMTEGRKEQTNKRKNERKLSGREREEQMELTEEGMNGRTDESRE